MLVIVTGRHVPVNVAFSSFFGTLVFCVVECHQGVYKKRPHKYLIYALWAMYFQVMGCRENLKITPKKRFAFLHFSFKQREWKLQDDFCDGKIKKFEHRRNSVHFKEENHVLPHSPASFVFLIICWKKMHFPLRTNRQVAVRVVHQLKRTRSAGCYRKWRSFFSEQFHWWVLNMFAINFKYSLIIHEENTKKISTMSETLYVINFCSKFLLDFNG